MAEEQTPRVFLRPNGPYVVEGNIPVRRRSIAYSEHGEPETWLGGPALETDGRAVLCRCGGSANKPFCDGSHRANGFQAADGELPKPYVERADTYDGTRIVVRDDRAICAHAGFCGNRLTNVWDQVAQSGDSIVRMQVMNAVERCPSGALTYKLEHDGNSVEPDLPAAVGIIDDGPVWLTGGIPVTLPDGTVLEVRNRLTLCRCGHSNSKPYCDGSHKETGFKDS